MHSTASAYNSQIRKHKFQFRQQNTYEQTEQRLQVPKSHLLSQFRKQPNTIAQNSSDWQQDKLAFPKVLTTRRSKTPIPFLSSKTPRQTQTTGKYVFQSSEDESSNQYEHKRFGTLEKDMPIHRPGLKDTIEKDKKSQYSKSQKTNQINKQDKNQPAAQKSSVSTIYSPLKLDQQELNLPNVVFSFEAKPTEQDPYVSYEPHQTVDYDNIIDKVKLEPQNSEDMKTVERFNHHFESLEDRKARTIQIKEMTRNKRNKSISQLTTQLTTQIPSFRVRCQSTLTKIKQQSQPSAAFSFGDQPKPSIIQQHLDSHLHRIITNLINPKQLPQFIQQYFLQQDILNQQVWQTLNIDAHQERILKKRVLLEMVAVLCVCLSVCSESLEDKESYLVNVLNYAVNNQGLERNIRESPGKQSHFFYRISNNNNIMVDLVNKLLKDYSHIYESLRVILKGTYKSQLSQSQKQLRLIICQIIHQHFRESSFPQLSLAPSPFLPRNHYFEYTLVISIDDTLVHQKHDTVTLRPFTRQFLYSLSQHFELVLFTGIRKDLIDGAFYNTIGFDIMKIPIHKLYRYHGTYSEVAGRYLVGLARLGRDEQKVVCVAAGYKGKLVKENVFYLKKWTSVGTHTSHSSLQELAEILKSIPENRKSKNIGKVKRQQRPRKNRLSSFK